MSVLGTNSGRDTDKVAMTSLTPVEVNNSMSFEEAECTIVLKIYYQDMDIKQMPEAVIKDIIVRKLHIECILRSYRNY